MRGCWGVHYCQWNKITTPSGAAADSTPCLSVEHNLMSKRVRAWVELYLNLYIFDVYIWSCHIYRLYSILHLPARSAICSHFYFNYMLCSIANDFRSIDTHQLSGWWRRRSVTCYLGVSPFMENTILEFFAATALFLHSGKCFSYLDVFRLPW